MDQLREDTRERTWEDYVETASAALAIGVGAAYFLRGNARQLNRFGEYLSSARRAFNEGAFNGFNLGRGFSRAKILANRESTGTIKIDTTRDRLFESAHRAADILNGGVTRGQAEADFVREFRTEYGTKAMNQMLEQSQHLDDEQIDMLRSMVSKFSSGEEITSLTLEANIRHRFGERAVREGDEVVGEALKIAQETQRLMRDDTNPVIKEAIERATNQNDVLSINLERFQGWDDSGKAIWDSQDVIERIEFANPAKRVQNLANTALNIVELERHQQELYGGPMERFLNMVLGDRVTFGEASTLSNAEIDRLFASRSAVTTQDGKPVFGNTFETLRRIRDQRFTRPEDAERFNKLFVANLRRGADGQIYSTAGIEDMLVNFGKAFSETLPGKMFRTTELLYNREQPAFKIFRKGTLDYSLATALGNHGGELKTIEDVVLMNGRLYESVGENWVATERLKDLTIMPNKVGTAREFMQGMRDARRAKDSGEKFLDHIWQEDTFTVRQLSEIYGNQFEWGLGDKNASVTAARLAFGDHLEQTGIMNRMRNLFATFDRYGTLQKELNVEDLRQLRRGLREQGASTTHIIHAMKILQDPTNEYAIRYASQIGSKDSPNSIANSALSQLLSDFQKDYRRTMTQHITRTDQTKKTANGVFYLSQQFKENLAQELVQESLLRAGAENIENVIKSGRFRGEKASNLRSFAATGIFNQKTNRHVYGVSLEEQTIDALKYLDIIQQGATAEDRFVFTGLKDLQKRFDLSSSLIVGSGERLGYSTSGRAVDKVDDWAVIHKTYGLMDSLKTAMQMVRQSNDANRERALINAAREAVKPFTQFFSGEDMFQAPSRLSIFGYRAMNLVDEQLNRSFNIFGRHYELNLGLNKKDKGSGYEILQNLVLKRVFPAAVAVTYLDFLDDSTRAITGMGLGEAGISGLANAYLGIKKITGATGLDYPLKGLTSDNPFVRYYAGYTGDINPEWNTYEEQKDYYERGYTPIRKARYWKFGSSNEYRGGKVSYFEPNTLRMMRSNYFMESMYEGSMWTKWSHSLLPTPLNPLSPLNYLIDPYYLEELHKEDRPYPITGSTFAENTPWGIVLNPFFDTFIKPRKEMYRDRLGEDGVDIKALIAHVNDDIRRRANNQQSGDILYLQNGKLRSMLFTAFNAPTPGERIIGQQGTSVTTSTEYNEYGSGVAAEEYSQLAESNANQLQAGAIAGSTLGTPANAEKLSVSDRLVISSAKGNFAAGMLVDSMKATGIFDALRGANMKIRQQGMLRKDQGLFYENKMQYESNAVDDLLANSETISDLMTQGKGHDYVHEMAVSARMVTGLYGYMASLAFGIGENNQKRIATSANMESAGRSFWDLSVGGFDPTGGDIMEIMRRFIPEYHRMQQINPLMNNLPDWLPDKFRFGDAYAQLPKGEARLPGRGYESLNQLHPDIYGRYGAFDRFKILADIAPYSPEYKFWKKVVSATVQDPELKKEIQEVKDRVAEQTKGHDFFDYKYVGRDMTQQNAVVSEVLNFGKFKIVGSEQIYKLSGVKIAGNPNETTQQVLSRYLLPGQEITMFMDENPAYARNNDKDKTINAGVMVAGENIAEQMLEAGDAKKRKGDTSAPSYMLNHGPIVNGINYISEVIGHANIPVFHSRWSNMNSPLEQYLDDNVYGTSFQSWSSPWATYIRPSLQIEASDPTWLSIGILSNVLRDTVRNEGKHGVRNVIRETMEAAGHLKGQVPSKFLNYATIAGRMLDRGALAGSIAGGIAFMGSSGALAKVEQMQKWGHMAGVAYAAMDNPNNLAVSTIAWSRLGYLIANELMHKNRAVMTAAGTAIGIARWAASKKLLASDDTANTYIPEETRKKWDMQDYFDRLTYIKYMGLFEQAADMAKEKEGIDIRAILAAQDKERKELKEQKEKLHQDLRDLDNRHDADSEEAKKIIRRQLNKMSGVKVGLRGGEFTKSALMYKNAADATMYGLQDDALMADIVRALPKTERDYFIEFMKEKDAEKREEILKTVSPLLNRALRTIWKMPLPEKVSNEEYFEHHTLPAPTWAGWRPDIDLANVEAKVIYNEGMQFSDMGIYASQYREPAVINAPNIEYSREQNSTLLTRLKLQMALTGTGVDANTVSVEPSQDSGIQVIANVARIIPYKINEEFENLFNLG